MAEEYKGDLYLLFSTGLPRNERDELVEKAKGPEEKNELSGKDFPDLVRHYIEQRKELGMRTLRKSELEDTPDNRATIIEILKTAKKKAEKREKEREADYIDLLMDLKDCERYIKKHKLVVLYGSSNTLDEIKEGIRKAEKAKKEKEETPGTPEYIERMIREKKWGKGQFEYNKSKNAWVFSDSDGRKYVVEPREDEQPIEGLDYLFSKNFHTSGEHKGKPIILDRDVFLVSLREPYPDGHKTRQERQEEEDRIKYERREGLVFGTEEYAQEFVEDGMWKKGRFRKEGDEWIIEFNIDGLKTKYIVEADSTQPYPGVEYYFAPSEKNVVSEGSGKDRKFKNFRASNERKDGGRVVERTYHVNLMPPYSEEHTKKAEAEAAEAERRKREETYGTEEYAKKKEREKEWMKGSFRLERNKWQIETKSPNDGRNITCVIEKNDPITPIPGLNYYFAPIEDGEGNHKRIAKDVFLVNIKEPLPEEHEERERVTKLEQSIVDLVDTNEAEGILGEKYVQWILEKLAEDDHTELYNNIKETANSDVFKKEIKDILNKVLEILEEIDPGLKNTEETMSKEELKEKISKIVSIFGKEKRDAILQFANSLDEPFDKGWLNAESAKELMEALGEKNQARAIEVLDREIDRNDLEEADIALGTIIDKVKNLFEKPDPVVKKKTKKGGKKADKRDKASKKKTSTYNIPDQKKEFNKEVQFRGDNLLSKFGKENEEKIGELIGKIRDLISSNSITVDSANGILDSIIKEDSGAALMSLKINKENADSANKKTFEEIEKIINSFFEEKRIDESVQDEGTDKGIERNEMTPVEEIDNLLKNTTFNGANDRIKKGVLLRISTHLFNREYDKAIDIMRRFFDVTSEIEEKIEALKIENPVLDSPKMQERVAATYGSEGGEDISPLENKRNSVRRQIESFANALGLEKNTGVIRTALLALNTDYPGTALRFLNNYGLQLDVDKKTDFDNNFREVEMQLEQFSALKNTQPEENSLDLEEKTIVQLRIQANRLIREFISGHEDKDELIGEIDNFSSRTKYIKIEEVKEMFNDLRAGQDPDSKDEAFRDIDKILNKIIEKQKIREGVL